MPLLETAEEALQHQSKPSQRKTETKIGELQPAPSKETTCNSRKVTASIVSIQYAAKPRMLQKAKHRCKWPVSIQKDKDDWLIRRKSTGRELQDQETSMPNMEIVACQFHAYHPLIRRRQHDNSPWMQQKLAIGLKRTNPKWTQREQNISARVTSSNIAVRRNEAVSRDQTISLCQTEQKKMC